MTVLARRIHQSADMFQDDFAQHAAELPGQTSETDIELNYQVQLTPYLYVRPNIQYVFKPNGLNTIRNALVLGAEVGITF